MMKDAARSLFRAERKARLVRDSLACRTGIAEARAALADAMRAENLVREGIHYLFGRTGAAIVPMLLAAERALPMLPLAVTTLCGLRRKNLLKPALGIALVIAALVTLARWRKR